MSEEPACRDCVNHETDLKEFPCNYCFFELLEGHYGLKLHFVPNNIIYETYAGISMEG